MNARRSACVFALGLAALNTSSCAATPHGDPWWSTDKAMHGSISAGVAMGLYSVGSGSIEPAGARVLFSAGITLGLGAGKELLDLAGLGTPSWRDFAWDVIGTAFGIAAAYTIETVIRASAPHRP